MQNVPFCPKFLSHKSFQLLMSEKQSKIKHALKPEKPCKLKWKYRGLNDLNLGAQRLENEAL